MSEAAIRLGPLDLAALLPQLGRLDHEIVVSQTEGGAALPSLAAAGLALPTGHATIALGTRSALRYRGLVLARQLAGGPTWEVTCLRLASDDGPRVTALLAGACRELLDRRARTVLVRYPDSRHDLAFRTAGFVPFAVEHLYAVEAGGAAASTLVEVGRQERGDIFRLYCRAVPESVRRHEAPTIDGFNAFHDAAAIEHDGIQLSPEGVPVLWVGLGAQESRVLSCDSTLIDVALDHLECVAPERRLVVPEFDTVLQAAVTQRGYRHVGTRTVAARHLARMLPLGEAVAVPAAGTVSIPHG